MSDCILEGRRVGDDGRDAYGRDDLPPAASPKPAPTGAMDDALAELQARALPAVLASWGQSRVAFLRSRWGRSTLEDLCPGLIWQPSGEADARCMEAWADHHEEFLSADGRDCRALRLYAAQIRTTVLCDCGRPEGCAYCDKGEVQVADDDARAA